MRSLLSESDARFGGANGSASLSGIRSARRNDSSACDQSLRLGEPRLSLVHAREQPGVSDRLEDASRAVERACGLAEAMEALQRLAQVHHLDADPDVVRTELRLEERQRLLVVDE